MDEIGDCRDKVADLEAIIGHMPTISMLHGGNFLEFDREVRMLLSFQDTLIYDFDEKNQCNLFRNMPFRFMMLEIRDPDTKEYHITFRSRYGEAEHEHRFKLADKPENVQAGYALAYIQENGRKSGALYLSSVCQNKQRTFVYYVKDFVEKVRNNGNLGHSPTNNNYLKISK